MIKLPCHPLYSIQCRLHYIHHSTTFFPYHTSLNEMTKQVGGFGSQRFYCSLSNRVLDFSYRFLKRGLSDIEKYLENKADLFEHDILVQHALWDFFLPICISKLWYNDNVQSLKGLFWQRSVNDNSLFHGSSSTHALVVVLTHNVLGGNGTLPFVPSLNVIPFHFHLIIFFHIHRQGLVDPCFQEMKIEWSWSLNCFAWVFNRWGDRALPGEIPYKETIIVCKTAIQRHISSFQELYVTFVTRQRSKSCQYREKIAYCLWVLCSFTPG